MRFIQLTFYRQEKTHGPAKAGDTGKKFMQAAEKISRVVPYEKSTKIVVEGGDEFEVTESLATIITKLRKC